MPYSTVELIERAAALGYDALAITLHDRQLDLTPFQPLAARRGVTLIPGIERTIEGKHVLLLNFSARATAAITSFDGLARLREDEARGLVVAPHPFYPLGNSPGAVLDRRPSLFHAVEINAMHARGLDFNRRAWRWAEAHGLPVVGGGDVHRLGQLGHTYSLVDSTPDPAAVCDAVRAGRVEVRTRPLTWPRAAAIFGDIVAAWIWTSARNYTARRLENRRAV